MIPKIELTIHKACLMMELQRTLATLYPLDGLMSAMLDISPEDLIWKIWGIGYGWLHPDVQCPAMDLLKAGGEHMDLAKASNRQFNKCYEAILNLLEETDIPGDDVVDLNALMDSLVKDYVNDKALEHGAWPSPQTFDRFRCIIGLIQLSLMIREDDLPSTVPELFVYDEDLEEDFGLTDGRWSADAPFLDEYDDAGSATVDVAGLVTDDPRKICMRKSGLTALLRHWTEEMPEEFVLEDLKIRLMDPH